MEKNQAKEIELDAKQKLEKEQKRKKSIERKTCLLELIGYLGIEAPFNNLNGEGREGVEENNISRGRDDPSVDVGGLKFPA